MEPGQTKSRDDNILVPKPSVRWMTKTWPRDKQVDKAFWLRLAEDWLKLAQGADKPPGGQP